MEITKKELSIILQNLLIAIVDHSDQYNYLIMLYELFLKAYDNNDKIIFIGIKD